MTKMLREDEQQATDYDTIVKSNLQVQQREYLTGMLDQTAARLVAGSLRAVSIDGRQGVSFAARH